METKVEGKADLTPVDLATKVEGKADLTPVDLADKVPLKGVAFQGRAVQGINNIQLGGGFSREDPPNDQSSAFV